MGESAHDARRARRSLVALFGSTFLELCGVFMFGPLMTFMLKARGHDTATIGAFGALPFAGIFCAAPFASRWAAALGARRALIASAAAPLVAFVGITLVESLALWALLYFGAGIAAALRWIVAEATVAELAGDARRGRIVGAFETMIGASFVVGPALLALLGSNGAGARRASAVAVALAAAALLASFAVRAPAASAPVGRVPRLGWRGVADALGAAPTVMAAGFVGGFFEGGLAALLPLYGLAAGFGAASSALLVSASGLGSTLAMLPAGAAADRQPRQRVMRMCAALTLAGTLALPWAAGFGALAGGLAFVWGGAGGALYTLAMIDLGHRHRGLELVNATAVLVLAYTAGGLLAPLAGGAALQVSPRLGFPLLLAAVAAAGCIALALPPRGARR